MELARLRRNAFCRVSAPIADLRPDHLVGAVEHAVGSHQVDAELVDVLVDLGPASLPIEPSGPGNADLAVLRGPDVGEAADLAADPQPHQLVPGDRRPAAPPGSDLQRLTAAPMAP